MTGSVPDPAFDPAPTGAPTPVPIPVPTTVLVADDEPAPRAQLVAALRRCWPGARVVAEAASGTDAWDAFLALAPEVCFLDIRMPGLNGLEVAQRIGGQAQVVLVTAYSEHAVAAFDAGAVDYVLKPVDDERLARAVARVQARLASPLPPHLQGQPSAGPVDPVDSLGPEDRVDPVDPTHPVAPAGGLPADLLAATLQRLLADGTLAHRPPPLAVLQAAVGREVRLIRIEDVVYFESDARYTRVVWQADGPGGGPAGGPGSGPGGDALLRLPLKELLPQLDAQRFWQVHRSVVVRCDRIAAAVRTGEGQMHLVLRGRPETLPVSRHFQALFKGQ